MRRQFTLGLDDNNKANALINYIRTLDFATIEEDECLLTNAQKEAIDEALEESKQGLSISHEEMMKQTKERYPNLF